MDKWYELNECPICHQRWAGIWHNEQLQREHIYAARKQGLII